MSSTPLITVKIDATTKIPETHRKTICPAPRSVKIELTARCDLRCLRGDTLIDTIYGRIPIAELAKKYETIPVYTYKDGEVFISDAINIRKTGENKKLVRVLFDDGSHIDCTPDHKFLQFKALGNGPGTKEWATEAQDLKCGFRIRAYRENIVGGGYLNIAIGRKFRKKRSRIVMEYILKRKLSKYEMIHHKDHNVLNDLPFNLEYTKSAKEHFSHHPEISERMRNNNPAKNMTKEWIDKISLGNTGKRRSIEQRYRYRDSKLGTKNPNYLRGEYSGRTRILEEVNHKVVSVTHLDIHDDVYCMQVPETGWFFANKVLVKNCFFCATSHNLRKKGDMDFEFLKHALYEMRNIGVEEIGMFYLGESMLYKKLPEAIDYAKHVVGFPYVFLTTNGRLAKPELLRRLFAAGLDSLKFSFNASDREQYRSVCGVDGFDKVVENIKAAKKIRDEVWNDLGERCGLYASSIQFDGEQHARMQEAVKEIEGYVDEHYWLPLYGQAGFTAGARGTTPVAGNIGRIGALRDSLPCWALFTEGHVTWDGTLTGCCFSHTPDFDFGDLKEMSFMEAWNSEKAQALRKANLAKDVTGTACEKCIAYASS